MESDIRRRSLRVAMMSVAFIAGSLLVIDFATPGSARMLAPVILAAAVALANALAWEFGWLSPRKWRRLTMAFLVAICAAPIYAGVWHALSSRSTFSHSVVSWLVLVALLSGNWFGFLVATLFGHRIYGSNSGSLPGKTDSKGV